MRSIDIPCEITIKAFFAKQTVEKDDGGAKTVIKFYPLDELRATLPSASYNRLTANFRLVFKDVMSLNIPAEMATQDKLPSVNENA